MTAGCHPRPSPLKPGRLFRRRFMNPLAFIIPFILVIAVLNRIEFGRFD
jgi:hypothetical protein